MFINEKPPRGNTIIEMHIRINPNPLPEKPKNHIWEYSCFCIYGNVHIDSENRGSGILRIIILNYHY